VRPVLAAFVLCVGALPAAAREAASSPFAGTYSLKQPWNPWDTSPDDPIRVGTNGSIGAKTSFAWGDETYKGTVADDGSMSLTVTGFRHDIGLTPQRAKIGPATAADVTRAARPVGRDADRVKYSYDEVGFAELDAQGNLVFTATRTTSGGVVTSIVRIWYRT
jgi:hypothetical protein